VSRVSFESASGLRPAVAYLFVAAVLLMVAGKAWVLVDRQQSEGVERPEREVTQHMPAPDFDIVDAKGRELAMSVQRMDLAMSPRAMWQAHTPRRIAERVAPLLVDATGQGPSVDELMDRFLPTPEGSGWISLSEKGWRLDFQMASRVREWIASLGLESGFQLVRENERPIWDLWWCPELVLSEESRDPNGEGDPPRLDAWAWGRMLADGLGRALWPDLEVYHKKTNWKERDEQRARIWRVLMPSAETVVFRGVPPSKVTELIAVLDDEKVRSHQMRLDFEHERLYPLREQTQYASAFDILGGWRHIGAAEAQSLVLAEQPEAAELTQAQLDRKTRELLERKFPRSGLEGIVGELLQGPWADIEPEAASYTFLKNRSALEGSRRYYIGDEREGATPVVHSTLDASLQSFLHEKLVAATKENEAALAMGMVVDVETGAVLAADGYSQPELWEFLPTWHLFTPGSTFKVIVMATALDDQKVTKDQQFDTHDSHYRIPGSTRVIREAINAPTGWISAETALARSVNAVMVQIGMSVDDEHFAGKLVELGYSLAPESGVGTERAGSIPRLPWKPAYSHASVCFGHELMVSLWQHAAGLATVLRGGEYRPLRVVDGIDWEGRYRPLPLASPRRVFSEEACQTVREMMVTGAQEGTGRHISAAEAKLGTPIALMSKTGTTEKMDSEPCLHLDLERNVGNLGRSRKDAGFVTFKQMMARQRAGGRPHKRSCYTSSICLVGRVEGEERELMTLIVVEEPLGKNKFGSDVAGPTAAAVLKEALGLTHAGVPAQSFATAEVDYGYANEAELVGSDRPWARSTELDW
jgi:cell division protein FtsI/penicillin-binding protein 2